MSIRSMTGFARVEGQTADLSWHWEIRTVNGRGRELRLRLPTGMDALEPHVREICARHIARGTCHVTLRLTAGESQTEIRLNETALKQVAVALSEAAKLVDAAPPRLDGILALRGVLESCEPELDEAERDRRQQAILESLETGLQRLVAMREAEGSHLQQVLLGLLDEIAGLAQKAEQSPSRRPDAILARLKEAIERLGETTDRFDPQRLHQEAVLLATRADITEEIDRLKGHVAAARELLTTETGPVGRKLDFLTQELVREANTLCAKANGADITAIGLQLKAVIDQMREQVQNIE